MMRGFTTTLAAAVGTGLIMAGAPAMSQQPAQGPIQQVQTRQAGAGFYAPFVWNGNALDQKILDAQAQVLPPQRLIRPHRHHNHRR
jgi:hypothetical protein